jgi:hypothetical protein
MTAWQPHAAPQLTSRNEHCTSGNRPATTQPLGPDKLARSLTDPAWSDRAKLGAAAMTLYAAATVHHRCCYCLLLQVFNKLISSL